LKNKKLISVLNRSWDNENQYNKWSKIHRESFDYAWLANCPIFQTVRSGKTRTRNFNFGNI
jgi:hypothetical protein